jgi:hypothetical protein
MLFNNLAVLSFRVFVFLFAMPLASHSQEFNSTIQLYAYQEETDIFECDPDSGLGYFEYAAQLKGLSRFILGDYKGGVSASYSSTDNSPIHLGTFPANASVGSWQVTMELEEVEWIDRTPTWISNAIVRQYSLVEELYRPIRSNIEPIIFRFVGETNNCEADRPSLQIFIRYANVLTLKIDVDLAKMEGERVVIGLYEKETERQLRNTYTSRYNLLFGVQAIIDLGTPVNQEHGSLLEKIVFSSDSVDLIDENLNFRIGEYWKICSNWDGSLLHLTRNGKIESTLAFESEGLTPISSSTINDDFVIFTPSLSGGVITQFVDYSSVSLSKFNSMAYFELREFHENELLRILAVDEFKLANGAFSDISDLSIALTVSSFQREWQANTKDPFVFESGWRSRRPKFDEVWNFGLSQKYSSLLFKRFGQRQQCYHG